MAALQLLFRCYKPPPPPFIFFQSPKWYSPRTNNLLTFKGRRFLCSGHTKPSSYDNKNSEKKKELSLWLYNTMSKEKELFKPKVDGKVGMYVCGVTAYDLSHIGHARVYVSFDILFRYLRFMGYEVNYVRNFTDVDDKIIARAGQLGEDPISLSRRFCEEFHRDMEFLHCLPPTVEPRVSDHMPQIIDMIKQVNCMEKVKRLEEKVGAMISDYENGYLSNLELLKIIDSIGRLGFGYRFQINIRVLDKIAKISENNLGIEEIEDDLHVVSLNFRLLQQHHYNVSQDISSL